VPINSKAAADFDEWQTSLLLLGRSSRTAGDYGHTLRNLLELHPKKAVGDFTTSDCKRFLSTFSPGSLPARYSALKSFFDHLYAGQVISTNPMHPIPRPKKPQRRPPEDFTDAEKASLHGLDSPDGPLMVLMFEWGLRKGEARALRRRDIHLGGEVRLTGRRKKLRKARITKRAHDAVKELDAALGLREAEYLWGTRPGGGSVTRHKRPVSETAFYMWWKKCVEKAGVRPLKPDTARLGYQRLQESPAGFAGAEALHALSQSIEDDLVRGFIEEALLCFDSGALRAGIVFLWSGAIRTLHERAMKLGPRVVNAAILRQDGRARSVRKVDDFAWIKDRTFLDAAPDMGLLDKSQKGQLLRALELRNDCGHPAKYIAREAKTRSYIEDVVGIVFR
jgi:integrase